MPKSIVLSLDTRDDRTEMVSALSRLSPADRLAWLAWCCKRVKGKHGDKVRVAARSTGDNPVEVFMDAQQLFLSYDLDPIPAAVMLERLVKRRGVGRRLWAAGQV